MATDFPTSLDDFTNPQDTDNLDSPDHAAQHANKNDAVEALEAKVGVDGSAVSSSHDYKIAALETSPVNHASNHTDGTDDIQNATAGQKGLATAVQITKLDGIEEAADVTDATNVATAGALMDGDLKDQDDMADDSETNPASQQSIKAYVDEQSKITTTIVSSATPTPARASKKTELVITAQAAAFELQNPSGILVEGDLFYVEVTDDGTGRAITYDTDYDDPNSATLPTDTTANKTLSMLYRYSD